MWMKPRGWDSLRRASALPPPCLSWEGVLIECAGLLNVEIKGCVDVCLTLPEEKGYRILSCMNIYPIVCPIFGGGP